MELDLTYQRKLMGEYALVGQIADDCITYLLRRYLSDGVWRTDIERGISKLLDQYLIDSKKWQTQYELRVSKPGDLRRQPIDREFFGNPLTEPEKDAVREAALLAVRNWQASSLPDWFVELGPQHWHPPVADSAAPYFMYNGIGIYAKYDFIIQTPEQTLIFDWKTGKRSQYSEQAIADQLHTYALYTEAEMSANLKATRLFGVWLGLGPDHCLEEVSIDMARIQRLQGAWVERHALLVERTKGIPFGPGEVLLQRFPATGYPNKCPSCPFHCCEHWQQVADSKA